MELIYILLSCLIWVHLESQTQALCAPDKQPSIKVCTDEDVTHTRYIHIDTISVPDIQQTTCECVITPYMHTIPLLFNKLSGYLTSSVQFIINDISIGKSDRYGYTNITDATKLIFSTLESHQSQGVCLVVYSKNGNHFNMSCTKATKTTPMQTFTTSVCQGSETTEAILELEHTTVFGENEYTAAVIPSVICALLLVITICLIVFIRRMRRRYENQQQSNEQPYTQQVSEMETRSEQVQVASSEATAAIGSLNEYERLNMYISPHCNAEMYQQLKVTPLRFF